MTTAYFRKRDEGRLDNDVLVHHFLSITRKEWRIWLGGAVLAFVAASLFMSGWPQGLVPETLTPFTYGGDGLSYLWNIKRVLEGAWFFENAHTGFPFGSNHLDYPTSDTGSYLALKLLGSVFHSPVAAANLYYLLGYSLSLATTYIVSRTLGISRHFSIVGAVLYAFTSFHFGRVGHLFFTWYFVAPLFFYYGFRIFSRDLLFLGVAQDFKKNTLHVLALMVLASFGIYYALFGCMVLAICAVLAATWQRSWLHLGAGLLATGCVVMGVLLNVAPSLVDIALHGENREGVNRLAAESELYALKITQLLLPRSDHRLESFHEMASQYNNAFPLVTENISASLGVAGSLGFVLLLGGVFVASLIAHSPQHRHKVTHEVSGVQLRLLVLSTLALALLMMATVGGFSSLFAMFVSTSIRSWNRISIFIAFLSVIAFVMVLDQLIASYVKPAYRLIMGMVLASAVLIFGVLDQTVKPCRACIAANKLLYENDKTFIQAIEKSLPKNASVYQLPYMAYPENGSVNGLGSYDQARGHIHSSNLNWSFGGIRGREGDWFYRKLALLPIAQQVEVIKAMGFSGIYVDRRGYLTNDLDARCVLYANSKTDRAKNDCTTISEVEEDIAVAIGPGANQKKLISQDGQLSFSPLVSSNNQVLVDSYLLPIGFKLVNGIPESAGGFEEILDLRKNELPSYVGRITGLSGITVSGGQLIGRWSDANLAKRVTVWLTKPLPNKFTLTVRALSSGSNVGKPVQIKIGKQTKELVFGSEFESKKVSFELSEPAYKIEFKPYDPFSPARRWGTGDNRLLAVEFEQISIASN
jgi:phosphoglycerol transferase